MSDVTQGFEFLKVVAVQEKENYLKVTFEENKSVLLKNVNGKIVMEKNI